MQILISWLLFQSQPWLGDTVSHAAYFQNEKGFYRFFRAGKFPTVFVQPDAPKPPATENVLWKQNPESSQLCTEALKPDTSKSTVSSPRFSFSPKALLDCTVHALWLLGRSDTRGSRYSSSFELLVSHSCFLSTPWSGDLVELSS